MKTTCIKHIGDSLYRLVDDEDDLIIYRVVQLFTEGSYAFRAEVIETSDKYKEYISRQYNFHYDALMYRVDICGQPVDDTLN